MSRINVPSFQELASRVLDVKGIGALTEVDDSVVGTIPLDRGAPVEWLSPQRIYPWIWGRQIPAGGAGTYSGAQLFNTTTDRFFLIRDLIFSGGASAIFGIYYVTNNVAALYGNALVGQPRDRRVVQTPTVGSYGSAAAAAPAGYTILMYPRLTTSIYQLSFPYLLYPGDSIAFQHVTANTAWEMAVTWETRVFNPGER